MTANPDTLPTVRDPSGRCPRCGRISNFTVVNITDLEVVGTPEGIRRVQVVATIECMGCLERSVVIEDEINDQHGRQGVLWWPADHLVEIDENASVPDKIYEAYAEGIRCLSVQAPNAAVALFRTVIAQIVEDRGSPAAKGKNTLYDRIDQMVSDRTLWDDFGDWAHHIRQTGNAGAHGEKFDPVTMEQAQELQQFVRELINFLYEQPARRAAAKPATKASAPTNTAAAIPTSANGT